MIKHFSVRELELIKLRASKKLDTNSSSYDDVIDASNFALHLLKENFLLKEKIFNIEQSISEEDKILNIIDAKLDMALFSNDKKDFLEINKSINNNVWTIIIQRKFGKTPQQLLKQSECRRLKASRKILNLHKEKKENIKNYKRITQDNVILYALKMDDPSEVIKSREDIIRAKKFVDQYVSRFNNTIYRKGSGTVHKSFHDFVRESHERSAVSENRALKAEAELKKLTEHLHRKKSPLVLVYECRKRKTGKLIKKSAYRRTL